MSTEQISPPSPHYHLTLLRHGQSQGNAAGYHQGQAEFPLTERGQAQARALARYWRQVGMCFDLIISSPLSRARQTAEVIAAELHTTLEFDPNWMERDNGRLSGLKPEEAAVRFPRPDFVHPYQPIGQTGESQWELYLRAGRAIQEVLQRPPGSYLVVSHGGLLNMALYAILGLTPHANFAGPRFRFRNTAYATLTYMPEQHKWYLEGLNERPHVR